MRSTVNSVIAFLAFLFGLFVFGCLIAIICKYVEPSGIIYRLGWFFGHEHTTLGAVLLIAIGIYVFFYGVTAGFIAMCYAWAIWWWSIVALFDLIGMLVRAPFSWQARHELRTLDFLKHPLLGNGGAPTHEMTSYAQDIARRKGIDLSSKTLGSYRATRSFLNEHSDRKI